jgi:hypothetical protein
VASRWSNPSGSVGVHRFRVWPASTDSYDHADLAANWDAADRLIGGPSDGSAWPPTTGVNGGLYKVVTDLKATIIPLGFTFMWWRPSSAVPIPSLFEVCDGRVLTASQHNFPGGGNITLPDMRHRMALGADATKTIGLPAVTPATDSAIDSASGAPGPQGVGGENQHVLTIAEMASHQHAGSQTGWSSLGLHWVNHNGEQRTNDSVWETYWGRGLSGASTTGTGAGGWATGQHRHFLNNLTPAGSNAPHENRPRYVGLLWLTKVKT